MRKPVLNMVTLQKLPEKEKELFLGGKKYSTFFSTLITVVENKKDERLKNDRAPLLCEIIQRPLR